MVNMAAQIPALFETLSGMKMGDLFAKIKAIGDSGSRSDNQAG
jgi:flotillin